MESQKLDHKDVLGWGVDADKTARPNYPMWKLAAKGTGAHWVTPEQQENFKDFYSMERPGPTHVFGSTVPPKGLSGVIRKFSFSNFSEGHWEHWILLLMADRIQIFEGLVDDIVHGTIPRLLKERGWEVDKKFKTKRYKKVVTFSILITVGSILLLTSRLKPEIE